MSTYVALNAGMSVATPFPARVSPSSKDVETGSAESSVSSCYSESDSDSPPPSECGSNAWVPAGVYVPVHRRSGSTASTAPTSTSSSPRSSKPMIPPTPPPKPLYPHEIKQKPKPRAYSRDELLVLAPSSLIHASLHPVITPALLAKHPRILRPRGDGVALALDMARRDVIIREYFASVQTAAKTAAPGPWQEGLVVVQQQNAAPVRSRVAASAPQAGVTNLKAEVETCVQQSQARPARRRARRRGRAQCPRNIPSPAIANLARRRHPDVTVITSWRAAPQAVGA